MLPKFGAILQNPKALETETIDALCFTCDVMEYGGERLFSMVQPNAVAVFNQLTTQHKDNEDTDIIQTIIYGYGIMATKMTPETYKPLLPTVMQMCEAALQHPEAEGDRIVFTENVIGAIGKLTYFQVPEVSLAQKFVTSLPLTNEKEEANKTHKLFFQQLLAKNANLMQVGDEALKTAVLKIKEAFEKEKDEILDAEGATLLSQVMQ